MLSRCFTVGVGLDQSKRLREHFVGSPDPHEGVETRLLGRPAEFLEPDCLAPREVDVGELGVSRAPPQPERLTEDLQDVGGGEPARPIDQCLEPPRIDAVGRHHEGVPRQAPYDNVGPERGPQPRDVRLERVRPYLVTVGWNPWRRWLIKAWLTGLPFGPVYHWLTSKSVAPLRGGRRGCW